MAQRIAIIDYGMGNLHSAAKALEHVAPAAKVEVTADRRTILAADRVVLPGVGAIRDCIGEMRRLGIDQLLPEVIERKPLLAICVGLQALLESSEENGGVTCLGLLPGRVRHFGAPLREADGSRLKVPHMGWSRVGQQPHPLWSGIADGSRFYFVHSYYVEAARADQVVGQCHYGVDFAAAMASPNLFAVQFHPEKSQQAGLALLRNFSRWDGAAVVEGVTS